MKKLNSAEVVVFAGGKGERMGDITRNRQKCLLPFEGEPILGHILKSIESAFGSAVVTVCVSYLANEVIDYVEKNKGKNIETKYVFDL